MHVRKRNFFVPPNTHTQFPNHFHGFDFFPFSFWCKSHGRSTLSVWNMEFTQDQHRNIFAFFKSATLKYIQKNSSKFLIYQSNMKPNTLFRSKAQNFRSSCHSWSRLLPIFQVRIGFVGNAKRRGDDKKGEGNAPQTHCQIPQKKIYLQNRNCHKAHGGRLGKKWKNRKKSLKSSDLGFFLPWLMEELELPLAFFLGNRLGLLFSSFFFFGGPFGILLSRPWAKMHKIQKRSSLDIFVFEMVFPE